MPAGGLATAAAISAGIGGAQTAFGAYQYLKGRQLAKSAIRPTYDIPMELRNKMSSAQIAALEGMSAQEREQYLANLQRVANFQMQAMADRKAGLVGAAELGQTQADALMNLATTSEQMRRENQRYLGQVQSEMAGEKQKQWEMNKYMPYQSQVTAAQAMQGAGLQNIWGGAGSAAKNIGAAAMTMGANQPTTLGGQMPTTNTGVGLGQQIGGPNLSQGLSSIPSPQFGVNDTAQLQALKATNPDLYMQIMSKRMNNLNFSY